eukprot:1988853-Pyramimonas_sp.AAC.1
MVEMAAVETRGPLDELLLQECRLPRVKEMSALGVMVHDEWTERYDLADCLKKADRVWLRDAAHYRCRSIPYRDRCLMYSIRVQSIVL